jgi:hypothetical protein
MSLTFYGDANITTLIKMTIFLYHAKQIVILLNKSLDHIESINQYLILQCCRKSCCVKVQFEIIYRPLLFRASNLFCFINSLAKASPVRPLGLSNAALTTASISEMLPVSALESAIAMANSGSSSSSI